jgi:hypothetical protein
MEVIQMAHAGTMDLGQTKQAARGGNSWLAVAVIVAIMAATVAAVWFTNGLTTSSALTARPAGDRSYDQIEAQRGLVVTAGDRSFDQIEQLRINAGRGPLVDESYNAIEKLRLGPVVSAVGRFDAYDNAEKIRGAGAVSAATVPGPADYIYQQIAKLQAAAAPHRVTGPGEFYGYEPIPQTLGVTSSSTSSMTSGTFHAGNGTAPATTEKRDRVGGP